MAIVINGNGIDMGNNPVSNVSIDNRASVVDKAYVDDLKIIATGTATFNSTTNNINLTGIGIGVEIGDVIQISGADDAKNNSEFTVEVITDNNNIIVNQAHANKDTSKNVAYRSGDTGVTVKLLSKWYNAPIGLGQGWVVLTSTRTKTTLYPNNTKRTIGVSITGIAGNYVYVISNNGVTVSSADVEGGITAFLYSEIVPGEYQFTASTAGNVLAWAERR